MDVININHMLMRRFHKDKFATGLSVIIFLTASISKAQLSGTITDSKTGKPINGVEVFVNKTTIATFSNDTGQFRLDNVLTGIQELVLYKKGYSIYRSSMKIQADHSYELKLSLTTSKRKKTTDLADEEKTDLNIRLSKNGDNSFVKVFGDKQIAISNVNGQRILSTQSPLTIQNDISGYRLKYFVMEQPLNELSQAPVMFEFLPTADVQQNINWEKNRKKYFQGCLRHWLLSLIANQLKQEGYTLQNEKGNEVDGKSYVSFSSLADYSKVTIDQALTVSYKGADGSIKTSRVRTNGAVDVNRAGQLINPKALIVEGEMSSIGLVDQLPDDYQPIIGDVDDIFAQTIERFYEKIYVHTDKPYYYPGEPLWFKGYINYKEPKWRDSLSTVVYVELINPEKTITLNKTLKIDSGFFHNDFILPDTLKEGMYYMRAYTNLNRNFGDSTLFVKAIPIVNLTDRVDHTQGKMETIEDNQLSITSDKKTYKKREKITLTLTARNKTGETMAANLSVSITDPVQVVPVPEPMTIANSFSFDNDKQRTTKELKYHVEYGISCRGRFLNDDGKPERTTLTVLQMNPRKMFMTATNEGGIFLLTGLHFYDTATFSFKPDKTRKEYSKGKVELLAREVPIINFQEKTSHLIIQSTQSPQRIVSDYEVPKDVRVLKTIEVRAKRIPPEYEKDYRQKRPYGIPNYVVKGKDIKGAYGDLMYSLQGIPGLLIKRSDLGWTIGSTRGGSIGNGGGILVTINDVVMGGDAAQTISSINPETVESIEVRLRMNVLYGSLGNSGIISIYTKQGLSEEALKVTPNFLTANISGYSASRSFRFPDYEDNETDKAKGDYRSTIYWNPNVTINPKSGTTTVSFFAADLPGKYRIIVEGVNEMGEPIRGVSFIEVDDN
jgi:hypothetical protein